MSYIGAILALGFLIFVHELGHFLFAKLFKVQVLEFAIGFGPKVYCRCFGETDYSLRAIPLGGFVRMAGESPSDLTAADEEPEEGDPADPKIDPSLDSRVTTDQSRWFMTQSFWPKFFIVLAGPAFNLFFAIFLAWGAIYFFGDMDYLRNAQIGSVMPGLPADTAGLKSGDLVEEVAGEPIKTWKELAVAIRASEGESVELLVKRQEERITLYLTPTLEQTELDTLMENDENHYKIGIYPATVRVAVGFWEAGALGIKQVYWISKLTLKGIYGMIAGRVSTDNIAGPARIFEQGAKAAKSGVDRLVDFMVFLSVSLALLNLLPIPVLDGGHLLFFIIEAIKGSPVSTSIQERATQVGMFALLCLMAFAISNDVRSFLE